MKYDFNGKTLTIPDKEISANMRLLEISQEEAIEMWLSDHELLLNDEQTELQEKASKVKIQHGAKAETAQKKDRKPRTFQNSDEKIELFQNILAFLNENYENPVILKDNKLISLQIGDKTFKIDIIQQRNKK